MIRNAIEHHVVMLPSFGEILSRVVDDPICAVVADASHDGMLMLRGRKAEPLRLRDPSCASCQGISMY